MRSLLISTIVLIACATFGQDAPKRVVAGFGAFPLSPELTSLWLGGADHHPLVMVYFHGPSGWHTTAKWKIDSHFGKEGPCWAELTSDNAELRVWLNPDNGNAEVQHEPFDIAQSNVFLVLNVTDRSKQRIVPLGFAELPASSDKPASVMLLESNNTIAEKLKRLIADNK